MTTKYFIQAHEKLLIERKWEDGERVFSEALNGQLTLEQARAEFAQDGNEVRALRLDPEDLNIEDVTEDLKAEDEEPEFEGSGFAAWDYARSMSPVVL